MHVCKRYFALLILFGSAGAACGDLPKIVDLRTGQETNLLELAESGQVFVFGEYHYNPLIQNAQAVLMEQLVTVLGIENQFDLGWEFLNANERDEVLLRYELVRQGEISVEQFLSEFLGEYEGNASYEVILETLRYLEGGLMPLNLSRSIKREVTRGGIEALDPQYLPRDFQLGSTEYYERFVEAMGEHVGDSIDNYFAAQSLVDNVMAQSLLDYSQHNISFLICGTFHSDYHDGVVAELVRRSDANVTTIKFVDATQMFPEEVGEELYSERYGVAADFAVILSSEFAQLQ